MPNVMSSVPGLSVVAIGFPNERNTEKIKPKQEIFDKFQEKNLYFADSFLKCSEVAKYFKNREYAFERASTYEFRTSARKSFLNFLEKKTGKKFKILDYTKNVQEVLNLEGELQIEQKLKEINKLKEDILFLQTFGRASMVLQMIDLDESNVIYADLSLSYAIHLLTGCEIVFDCLKEEQELVERGFERIRRGLLFFYKYYGIRFFSKPMGEGIVATKNGIKYFSQKETFYLMNGQPQNGFCFDLELNQYSLLKNPKV